ncbi:hypothetical protein H1Q59_08565 [Holosporaceae bacterium 'Namur']|nr:hypothetical protein [Holosporaceae bacterium 'Namur']
MLSSIILAGNSKIVKDIITKKGGHKKSTTGGEGSNTNTHKGENIVNEHSGKHDASNVNRVDSDKVNQKIGDKKNKEFDHESANKHEQTGFKHFIEVDGALLKKEIKLPDDYNSPKLRKKFDSHKVDFGMEDMPYNKKNADIFKQKIVEHIKQDDIIVIAGTHRGTEKVIHYFDKKTKVNVMKDLKEDYVSGWKLSDKQIKSLETTGNVQ